MSSNLDLEKINQTPHAKKLELQLISANDNSATLKLPFSNDIIGDPINRYIHGGAITTLIDTACGAAIFEAQQNTRAMATLDLRVDYLRPAKSGQDVLAHAECYKLTHTLAFVRVITYEDDIANPIATAVGAFIRSNKNFSI